MQGRRTRSAPVVQAILVTALFAGASLAGEIVEVPASRDGTLIETAGAARASGSGPTLFAGRVSLDEDSIRRGVIAFDVAAHVPPGSRVKRAALVLHVDRTGPAPGDVSLHRLLADWGEGASSSSGGRGAPAAPGDATWLHTFFDVAFWGSPGGDFDPQASSVGVPRGDGLVVFGPAAALAHDVQAWLDDPATAHGWLLRGDESMPGTVVVFDSRESRAQELRPVLLIDYVPRRRGKPGRGAVPFADHLERLRKKAATPPSGRIAAH